jgi:hypothetical protein
MHSIGDSGDPCGIPAGVAKESERKPVKRSCVFLPLRKQLTHFMIARRFVSVFGG